MARIPAALPAATLGLAILGLALVAELRDPTPPAWELDSDRKNALTWFSACVLALAGTLAIVTAAARRDLSRPARAGTVALGGVLLFMAVDDLVKIHEPLEADIGIYWQIVYLPIALAAAAAWALTWSGLTGRASRLAFLVGALAWVASQAVEGVTWGVRGGDIPSYGRVAGAEEVLEMSGSALFLVALHWSLRLRLRAAERHPTPT